MRKRNVQRYQSKASSGSQTNPLSWSYFVVLIVCGCVLAVGFFLAARQHFTSMDLGIKNSRLRRQLEDLEAENRRLLLAKEVSLSPAEIMKTAKNLGFREVETAIIALQPAIFKSKNKAAASTASANKDFINNGKSPVVKMTAFQNPVRTSYPEEPYGAKNADAIKDKKEKREIPVIAKK